MELVEAPAVGLELVEILVRHPLERPVAADQQVGTESPVQLRAALEVADPVAVAVLVVEDRLLARGQPRRLLVAGREHAVAVDLEEDRGRVERVPRHRVRGQLVLVPGERLLERQDAVDGDRLVPEAGQVVAVRVDEDRRDVLRRPDLRTLDLAEEGQPGDVVVVVVGRDHGLDPFDPMAPLQLLDRPEQRPPRGPLRDVTEPGRHLVAEVDQQRRARSRTRAHSCSRSSSGCGAGAA